MTAARNGGVKAMPILATQPKPRSGCPFRGCSVGVAEERHYTLTITALDAAKLVEQMAEGTGARIGGAVDPVGSSLEPGPGAYAALLTGLAETIATCLEG